MDKPGDFIGREALLRERAEREPGQRLRTVVLEDRRTVCIGSEPVRLGGSIVGRVTSGAFGHRIGESIALAYLPATLDVGDVVDVGFFGTWVPATIADDAPYDPSGSRLRPESAALTRS